MDNSRIDYFMMNIGNKMPPERYAEIETMVRAMDDSQFNRVASMDYKDTTTMLLISVFLGGWGVDRFILGDIGMGVLKLLTGGVCGVLWIIDIINSKKMTYDYNFHQFMMVYGAGRS